MSPRQAAQRPAGMLARARPWRSEQPPNRRHCQARSGALVRPRLSGHAVGGEAAIHGLGNGRYGHAASQAAGGPRLRTSPGCRQAVIGCPRAGRQRGSPVLCGESGWSGGTTGCKWPEGCNRLFGKRRGCRDAGTKLPRTQGGGPKRGDHRMVGTRPPTQSARRQGRRSRPEPFEDSKFVAAGGNDRRRLDRLGILDPGGGQPWQRRQTGRTIGGGRHHGHQVRDQQQPDGPSLRPGIARGGETKHGDAQHPAGGSCCGPAMGRAGPVQGQEKVRSVSAGSGGQGRAG